MAFNLLDTVQSYLSPGLVERTSSYLGEPTTSIDKGFTATLPTVLAMFVNRAERGDAQGLLHDAHEAVDSGVLSQPERLFSGDMSSFLAGGLNRLEGVLGSNATNIISSIARFADIKSSSVQGLMGIVASLGLGVIGRYARENNLSSQGLRSYLTNQRSSIIGAMPAGFSLGSLFGDRVTEEQVTNLDRDVPRAHYMEAEPKRKSTNLVPLLIVLGLGAVALIWFLSRRESDKLDSVAATTSPAVTTTTIDTHAARATVPTDNTTTRERTNVRLVNGQEINAYRGGVEDQLVTCLNSAGCAVGKDQWYDFDNINFETGSAKLTAESQQQVQNIVAILNAYPKAKIKIGGYTDKTGNAAVNKQLSQQRADAVMKAIKAAGANASQLVGAEGYGSSFAKVDASASDEERRKDRRIAVQLRGK